MQSTNTIRNGPFFRLRSELGTARHVMRNEGFRSLARRYGWKLFAVIFAYYVVRDVTLYILLPMFLFKSVV